MQMIDLMKRLQELDAQNPSIVQEQDIAKGAEQNPNVVREGRGTGTPYDDFGNRLGGASDERHDLDPKPSYKVVWGKGKSKSFDSHEEAIRFKNNLENKYPGLKAKITMSEGTEEALGKHKTPNLPEQNLEECGMMDSMGSMSQPRTPASINMTAASGEELSGMLKDIMSLAGMQKVTPDHMGMDHDPMVLTTEPVNPVGPAASDQDVMRSMIDKMNPDDDNDGKDIEQDDDEEETKETVDSMPDSSIPETPFNANQFAHQENQPGQGDRMDGPMPRGNAFEEQLMAEYKRFISEEQE